MTDGDRDVLHETFDAERWVQWEVDANVDSYGNTSREANRFVLDLLEEGEYDAELEEDQVAAALVVARNRLRRKAVNR